MKKLNEMTDAELQELTDKLRSDKEKIHALLRVAVHEYDRRSTMPVKENSAHDISGAGGIESEEA